MNSLKPVLGRKAPFAILLLTAFLTASLAPVAAAEGWQAKVDSAVLNAANLGSAEFIVYLEAKADLSGARTLGSKFAKGAFVHQALTTTAASTQAPVKAVLERLGREYRSFWISNAIVTSGDQDVLEAVASLADVKAVYAIGKGELQRPVENAGRTSDTAADAVATVGPSINHVNADEAWALGYKGQGVVVAGADTGVRWTHEAIKSKYRGWDGSAASHDYNWRNAAGPNAGCPADTASAAPCDDADHGTHTVGTIVGGLEGTIPNSGNPPQSKQIGMAPDAEWIACRNMTQGWGAVPTYMDCMQWFIAPTKIDGTSPDPSKAPDVVNNSWGCVEVCAPPILRDIAEASRAAGIVYIVSAGNDNQFFLGLTMACNTINFPLAVYDSVFTVGATNRTNDSIAYFSSLGPVSDNFRDGVLYKKPDIVAPGVDIWSATSASDSSYEPLGGTSMAGPHVAGLVALILSANPDLKGDVATIERIIRQSAKPLPSSKGCGGDTSVEVPNNEFGWGRIDALAAVQLALETEPSIPEGDQAGEALDPAHNTFLPCELISGVGSLPRSAKNVAHVANVCELVGTDIEFQSRSDDNGVVHDYAFLGTMGQGTRIFDITDPRLPRFVGAYTDPGWQNDVSVFGDTLVTAFDPLGGPIHLSECLKQKNPASTRGGVDVIKLRFDPILAALKSPLTFQTERVGCYLNNIGGGAHTITVHPSGEWLSVNTSTTGIEVVDLRSNALTMVRKIPVGVSDDAHDVSFSRDGNTMYVAGISSTRLVDVSDIFNREPTVIAEILNNPPAERGADGRRIAISHQSDTTSDGRVLIVTDEKGGGLNQTSCNTSATGTDPIGGAHMWALEEISGIAKSAGASTQNPMKIGTWIYPNPTLGVDPLDDALAGIGRQERACTIHVFRAGGNGGFGPATAGQGADGKDGVSRLPVNEIVSAHYGAGVWHVDVMSPKGPDDVILTTWGKTLGWNVMPGAETWSAKEYKGYIYAGDMVRGFDVYAFKPGCQGATCVDAVPAEADTDEPMPDPPSSCIPDNVYFLGVVNDGNAPGEPREDFRADMGNFEFFLQSLRKTYCIPDDQASILAFTDGWRDANGNPLSPYPEASEANVKAEIARLGDLADQHDDSIFFFFLSSHGIVYGAGGATELSPTNLVIECPPTRLTGSLSGLKPGGGQSGNFFDCELGAALNNNFKTTTEMFIDVDCSFCGGFSESLTAASGTVPDNSASTPAGIVAPNRIVITGCAMTTECFGDSESSRGGVSFGHMRDVLEGEHTCDGWTGPAFPTLQGFDIPVQNGPRDGDCSASEWFYAAVDSALNSGDPIAVQQQFRMKYGMGSLANDIMIRGGPGPRPAILRPDACTAAPFNDVAIDHPFCPEINWLKLEGITRGYEDGSFRPAADITRQAMAAFLARLKGAATPACTEAPFSDVPVDHPFCAEINWMKTARISNGFSDGTFRPSLNVTRQAMAAFLARVVGADTSACTEPPFSDVAVDHPFCAEIKWLKGSGITSGYEDGTFRPSINVTRQAMAAFLYRTSLLL